MDFLEIVKEVDKIIGNMFERYHIKSVKINDLPKIPLVSVTIINDFNGRIYRFVMEITDTLNCLDIETM